jgi:hypothetical protein
VATPIVSAILDAGGEIAASVDDITAIEEHVTPAWIQRFEDVIAAAPIVLLDANLLPDAILTACQSKGWTLLRCFVSLFLSRRRSHFETLFPINVVLGCGRLPGVVGALSSYFGSCFIG